VALLRRPGPFAERVRGSIDWLFVREDARRAGVGRSLVEAGLAWMRERGAARVELEVAIRNEAALAFWQALGFRAQMSVLDRAL
jgi:ribosomal protein S18 acetylase RimI-like enzyme